MALVTACSDDPPPCSVDGETQMPGGPVHGPADPGPTFPAPEPDGAGPDEHLGTNTDGEVCRCSPYDVACGHASAEQDTTGGQVAPRPVTCRVVWPTGDFTTWQSSSAMSSAYTAQERCNLENGADSGGGRCDQCSWSTVAGTRDWYCNVAKTRASTGERRTWTIKVQADGEPGAREEAYRRESSDPRYTNVVVERCWQEQPN
jgi:hypothetical protein